MSKRPTADLVSGPAAKEAHREERKVTIAYNAFERWQAEERKRNSLVPSIRSGMQQTNVKIEAIACIVEMYALDINFKMPDPAWFLRAQARFLKRAPWPEEYGACAQQFHYAYSIGHSHFCDSASMEAQFWGLDMKGGLCLRVTANCPCGINVGCDNAYYNSIEIDPATVDVSEIDYYFEEKDVADAKDDKQLQCMAILDRAHMTLMHERRLAALK